jgi:hypothetical protein
MKKPQVVTFGKGMRWACLALLSSAALGSCASAEMADVGLEALRLDAVGPIEIVPGTALSLKGESFVDATWGTSSLRLVGTANNADIDLSLYPTFIDFETMTLTIDNEVIEAVGGNADFSGVATLEVRSEVTGGIYRAPPMDIRLKFRRQLSPSITSLPTQGVIFVNESLVVEGDGFLLGGGEGSVVARVSGCFLNNKGGDCKPVTSLEVPAKPTDSQSRRKTSFAFSPDIAGIESGTFIGEVAIVNRTAAGGLLQSSSVTVRYDMVEPEVFRVTPTAASLGQYVYINGGGFVGGERGAVTELELVGAFQNADTGLSEAMTLTLIPEFVAGNSVRYVLNTDDALGQAISLRKQTGTFVGTIAPFTTFRGVTTAGRKTRISLQITPVKQVVYLDFRPSYVEGLRDFGLRAVDGKIRKRIVEVVEQAYHGVNLELRQEPPTDFAQYEHVELYGVDPNGLGLYGYDNTHGKDQGNARLYDRLGGFNALTQQGDGQGVYPGFGGVFVRSLLSFSLHPKALAEVKSGADPVFDKIFDVFRPDLDGTPVTAVDTPSTIKTRSTGEGCPSAKLRSEQISCAVFTLGNLIGGTLAHEIGHSLGLANPQQAEINSAHNFGDEPNRLMDNGGARPFLERAELMGQGPGVFCTNDYLYLRQILPTDIVDSTTRPGCE